MIKEEFAKKFAHDWAHAWNTRNIDNIMLHYAENVVFQSPVVVQINNDPSGTISGKTALQAYFTKALGIYTDLHFDLLRVLTSVHSVILYYRSINDMTAAEFMELDLQGKIVKVCAHYSKQTYGDHIGYNVPGLL